MTFLSLMTHWRGHGAARLSWGIAALLTLFLLSNAGPAAAISPAANVTYRIEAKHSGRALWGNIYNSSSNIEVYQNDFDGSLPLTFFFVSVGSGYYTIAQDAPHNTPVAASARLVLDTRNAGATDTTHARLATADGSAYQQWSLTDAGSGYVYIVNRQTGKVVSIHNGTMDNYVATDVVANGGYDYQKFWIEEVRPAPVQGISVSAGYGVKMPKRFVLCSNTNLGTSVSGTLSGNGSTNTITFNATQNIWGQYYYDCIDTYMAAAPATYTVSVSGFPSQSFVVADTVYRAVPNNTGTAGVGDIENGFFTYQRITEAQTGLPRYLSTNSGGTRSLVLQSGTSGDLHGGWHDATSTDMETAQNGTGLRDMSYAAEDAQNATDKTTLLSEVTFDADFLIRLQNSDGSWPISIKPATDDPATTLRKLLVNVDTGTASKCVLGLAAASRVLQSTNATLAAQCLTAAQKGWTWIKANPNNYITDSVIYDSLGDWTGDADSVLASITELALTSPTTANQNDFSTYFYDGQFNNSGVVTSRSNWVKRSGSYTRQTSGLFAAIALSRYLSHTSGQLRLDILNQVTTYFSIVSAANTTAFGIDTASLQAYRGQNERVFKLAYAYLNIYAGIADVYARNAALDQYNWVLGTNPFGASFVVNFGKLNVISAFARARAKSVGEILPGVEVSGTTSIISAGSGAFNFTEGAVGPTTLMPAFMMLMDKVTAHPPSIAGTIPVGATISLKSLLNNNYASADRNLADPPVVVTDRTTASYWEWYTVVDNGNGYVALQSHSNSQFVSAGDAGSSPLIVNKPTGGSWETYQWIDLGGGNIALKSLINDKFVNVDTSLGTPAPLIANTTTIGTSNKFLVTTY